MFSFIAKPYKKQDGSLTNIILVTGDDVDSTYPYKDQMKNFGAKWIEKYHTWGWWGSPDKNAVKAFDSVAKAADAIINGINEKIKQERGMNESKEYLTEVNYTGQDIAKMVGAEDLYLNGLKEFEAEEQAETGMYENTVKNFKSLVNRINETDKRRTSTLFD